MEEVNGQYKNNSLILQQSANKFTCGTLNIKILFVKGKILYNNASPNIDISWEKLLHLF